MTQHTSGPWTLDDRGTLGIYIRSGNILVAGLNAYSPDACLIAAAPEMLIALQVITTHCDCSQPLHQGPHDSGCFQDWPMIRDARALLAKVEGKK